MSQYSIMWPTSTTGDGASKITDAQWREVLRRLFLKDPSAQGVLRGLFEDQELSCAVGLTNDYEIVVQPGTAIVQGFIYWSDDNETVTLPVPTVGSTGFRIVIRATWGVTRTVRVGYLMSSDGVSAIPAVTQVDGTLWEISLASGVLNTDGTVTGGEVTDIRQYAHYNTKVSTGMLDDASVTSAKLAAAVAGDGLAGGAGSALSVNTDGVGIEINADALRLKDLGVVTAKINDLAVTTGKLAASSVTGPKIGVGGLRIEKRRGDDASDWSSGTTSGDPGQVNFTLANPVTGYLICQELQIAAASVSATSSVEFPAAFTAPPACMVSLVRDDLNEGVFLEVEPTFGSTTTHATVTARRGNPGSTASPLNLCFQVLVFGE